MTKQKDTTIPVEKAWLESLLRYAENAKKEGLENKCFHFRLSGLIGYISSIKEILRRN